MKKRILVLLLVVLIIVLLFFVKELVFKNEESEMIFYKNQSNSSIQVDNLQITVKGIFEKDVKDEDLLDMGLYDFAVENIKKFLPYEDIFTLIEFASVDGREISEPNFDYIVYDDEKNIIQNSIVYTKDEKRNSFFKYFNKEEYNSNDKFEHMNHLVCNGTSISMVGDDGKSILMLLYSKKIDEANTNFNLSNINVIIYNPSYRNAEEKERIKFENTVFEFDL